LRRENGLVDSVLQVGGALWLYAFLVVLVTAASWLNYVHRKQVFSYQGAFDSRPFFTKEQRFNDQTNYIGKTAHLRHGSAALGDAQVPVFNYPPPAAFVYKALLYAFPGHAVRTYLALLAISILGFAFVVWRAVGGTAIVRISAAAAILTTAVLGYALLSVYCRPWEYRGCGVGRGCGGALLSAASEIRYRRPADRSCLLHQAIFNIVSTAPDRPPQIQGGGPRCGNYRLGDTGSRDGPGAEPIDGVSESQARSFLL
jgi:hypothetical protein